MKRQRCRKCLAGELSIAEVSSASDPVKKYRTEVYNGIHFDAIVDTVLSSIKQWFDRTSSTLCADLSLLHPRNFDMCHRGIWKQRRNEVRWRPGKFDAPMLKTKVFRKQMYCTEQSTCDIVGTFWRPSAIRPTPQWFGALIVTQRPGNLRSPCPPSLRPCREELCKYLLRFDDRLTAKQLCIELQKNLETNGLAYIKTIKCRCLRSAGRQWQWTRRQHESFVYDV